MPTGNVVTLGLQRLRTRLRTLAAARGRRPGRQDIAALVDRIASCRTGFLDFGQTSDLEFTSLARGLSQLNTRLIGLRTETAALEAVLQDRDEERAISSAYSLYKDSVDLVRSNAGIAVSAQQQLTEVEGTLVKCCHDRETFERDHLFLRIVTLSIRIEASRLPPEAQSVFLNVASAISETGERIQTCTSTAFARIEAVIAESQAARAELDKTEQALQQKARKSIETIQRELGALQTALAPCADESRAIGELLATAQPQTLQVIVALQHQDIVRQQLEHVSEGFQDLEDHLRVAQQPGGTFRAGPKIEWDYVDHAARIQAAQLGASRTEIEGAGTAVIGGLQALLDTSAAMVERFAAMEEAASAALGNCRIAEMFSQELKELTKIIEQSQQANARTARLVDRIEEVVRLFSEEIGRYELDVKIVALNAQIAAARLSSADALNKLAEETSHVSDTNARVTHELSANLQSNLGRLERVKTEGATFLGIVTRERSQLEQGLQTVGGKLARLVERVRTGAAQARKEFEPVHYDCRALLSGLSFPAQIEDTFGPSTQLCRELVAASASSARTDAPSASALAKIKQHQDRYTMEKENATHAASLGQAPVVATTAASAAAVENIELFDAPVVAPTATHAIAPSIPATPVATPVSATSAAQTSPSDTPPPTPLPAAASDLGDGIELF